MPSLCRISRDPNMANLKRENDDELFFLQQACSAYDKPETGKTLETLEQHKKLWRKQIIFMMTVFN